MTRSILLILITLSAFCAVGQDKVTVSGYVRDASTGEDVFAANVFIEELVKGTTTNMYGFYSISVDPGTYTLVFSYIGLEEKKMTVDLTEDREINVELGAREVVTQEVVVSAKRKDRNVESSDIGTVELETRTVKEIPALLGEADIFRTLQLLPGVQSAGEGNSGLYVRGGGPDQNLVLLDNATVYNPGHLLGFFSVFNADAIKNTTLIKGGIPAEYGGRISSVLDISMREGNLREHEVEGGIGAISTRLTVQGPIVKDRAAYIVSGRITHLPILLNPVLKRRDNPISIPWFFDVNAKVNVKLGDRDRLFLSGYVGRDLFSFTSGSDSGFFFELPYGNATATLRWNHQFNDKMFMNNMVVFNDYTSKVRAGFRDVSFNLNSGIRDLSIKGSLEYFPSITNKFKAGYEYSYHIFTPYIFEFTSDDDEFTSNVDRKRGHEFALFVQDEVDVTDWLKIHAGLRGSMFSNTGPTDRIYFGESGNPIDTVSKSGTEAYATYFGIEPRLNARFKINSSTSIKTGFNMNRQYMHLVSNSTTTLPFDLWVPSTDIVRPQTGVQVAAGFFKNFKDDMYETSIEGFYKRLWNQVEFGDGVQNSANQETEDQFVFGDGEAYGVELFAKKVYGDFTGWIGYTLSWSFRTFPDIDGGDPFPTRFDRRHDLSVVLSYAINEKWKLSTTFVYGSGQTQTPVVNRYFTQGDLSNVYGERNSFRLPAYHRWDLSAVCVLRDDEDRYSDLNISIYNVYSRMNPYFIYDDVDIDEGQGTVDVQARQVSLFPILPTVTWNFRF